MKPTGIVRRIDDLGRLVVPKEIRKTMRIEENDPFEIFIEGNKIIYQKYTPASMHSDEIKLILDALYRTGVCVALYDRYGYKLFAGSKSLEEFFPDNMNENTADFGRYYVIALYSMGYVVGNLLFDKEHSTKTDAIEKGLLDAPAHMIECYLSDK